MEAKYYFLTAFAALALAGCSSEDTVTTPINSMGDGNDRYLTVNIVNNDSGTRTRAAGDETSTDEDGTYEEGLDAENKVGNIRFYFFDGEGNAAAVQAIGTQTVNYVDCTSDPDSIAMPNIEERLAATLVIQTYNGAPLPEKMVAVLNATGKDLNADGDDETTLDKTLSLSQLKAILAGAKGKYKTDKGFVMSSSVYLDSEGALACEANDVNKSLKETEEDAKKSAVKVYVERTAAKVRVKLGDDLTDPSVAKKDKDSDAKWQYIDKAGDSHDIYVEFLGWEITNVAKKSYLFKKIETGWNKTLTTDVWQGKWNYPENTDDSQISYRCFWAENPSVATGETLLDNTGLQWGNTWKTFYSSSDVKDDNYSGVSGDKLAYCLENAADNSDGEKPWYDADKELSNRTQVVLKAQLQDKDGNNIDVAQWQGKIYLRSVAEQIMKDQAALVLYDANGKNVATGVDYKFVYAQEAVKTVNGDEVSEYMADANTQNSKRYMTYIQCAEKTDYTALRYKEDGKLKEFGSVAAVNAYLSKIAPAKVWYGGKTYFYTDIEHLGKKSDKYDGTKETYNKYGQYGVVRNHIYDVTINSFTGIGTPSTVDHTGESDEDVDIIPQKTTEEDWYLYAKVNILSWRVVTNSADLEW